MPPSGTRRRLLAALGAGPASLAGCVGDGFGWGSTTTLGCVAVQNWHPRTRTIEVRARQNGEVVHRTTHAIPGATYTSDGDVTDLRTEPIPGPWPLQDLPVLDARLEGRDAWQTAEPGTYRGPECTELVAAVMPDGGTAAVTRTPSGRRRFRVQWRVSTRCGLACSSP